MSRRGQPLIMHSDNFSGARAALAEGFKEMLLKAEDVLSIKGIKWLHISAYSPSKVGIWEAGVKSVKFFLKRMEDSSTMTYEDFNTALCKIEALLNSRPMYPLSNNPEELEALTPAHFAIQRTFLHTPAAPPYQEDG